MAEMKRNLRKAGGGRVGERGKGKCHYVLKTVCMNVVKCAPFQ